ncbi:MAG: regulatory iron-sulfur-containing complex subunit RicT [Flavobacteriales bacterium]|nr:regulatory iron-sulfur-containing complex subunit RicT [Flavobacteriales bacterium]
MGCSSCSTSGGLPTGCKNNGVCGTYGCNKLEVFDWLSGIALPDGQKAFDIVEVRFKNSRKGYYRNSSGLELYPGDVVTVDVSPGFDIGVVSVTGELVKMQMKRKDVKDNFELKKILRKSKQEEIEKWQEARLSEKATMMRARTIATELRLQMKLSDVEYQGDKTRATFFYTAEDRVDFRELIKRFAEEFRVKIEMRQIGYRAEAGRLGGIGSCGRELCCSTWLTDFRSVSTSAARYQQLSLNPTKLAGQCGKLKCCLNYELDQYVEAVKDIPSANTRLQLAKGTAYHFKTDIFRRMMFFTVEGHEHESPVALSVSAVHEILALNKSGNKPEDIHEFVLEEEVKEEESTYGNVVGQDSLTRFDQKKNRKKKGGSKPGANAQPKSAPQGNRPNQPQGNRPPRPEANRPPRNDGGKPQGERSPRADGPKPEGGSPPNGNKPQQGERKPQGPRPPQGDKPQGERPQGPRPPRPEGGPQQNENRRRGDNRNKQEGKPPEPPST